AQILVGEIVHMLEDRKPRHQSRRQRRMSSLVRIDGAEPPLEKAPVDRQADGETESRPTAPINLQEIKPTDIPFLQMQGRADPRERLKNLGSPDSSRTTP